MEFDEFSCVDCYKVTCDNQNFPYPKGCNTEKYAQIVDEAVELFTKDEQNKKLAIAAAQVEGNFYGKKTRVEETLIFAEKTDLNVMMGLCVGHDSLFIKYSEAPVTVLFTKDRVTGHNAVQPLYLTESYYKRLV